MRPTVKRSSDIFKRTIAELKSSMRRTGFAVISEEEAVAVDLGWEIQDHRNKIGPYRPSPRTWL